VYGRKVFRAGHRISLPPLLLRPKRRLVVPFRTYIKAFKAYCNYEKFTEPKTKALF
jgi:hypothetical protein